MVRSERVCVGVVWSVLMWFAFLAMIYVFCLIWSRLIWCDFIHIWLGSNGRRLVWFEVVWCDFYSWRWSISFGVILLWFGQDSFGVTLFRSGYVGMGVLWCVWCGLMWFGVCGFWWPVRSIKRFNLFCNLVRLQIFNNT